MWQIYFWLLLNYISSFWTLLLLSPFLYMQYRQWLTFGVISDILFIESIFYNLPCHVITFWGLFWLTNEEVYKILKMVHLSIKLSSQNFGLHLLSGYHITHIHISADWYLLQTDTQRKSSLSEWCQNDLFEWQIKIALYDKFHILHHKYYISTMSISTSKYQYSVYGLLCTTGTIDICHISEWQIYHSVVYFCSTHPDYWLFTEGRPQTW